MSKRSTNQSKTKMTLYRKLLAFGLLALVCLPSVGCKEWLPQQGGVESKMYTTYKRGLALFKSKKYNMALGVFLQLQSEYPNQLELMYNLGTVYYHLGKPLKKKNPKRKEYLNKAEKNLRQVLNNGSAQLRQKANYNLGLVHTELSQYEQALMHFSGAATLARKTLKKPDTNAEFNRDQISMIIRQRERKRENLNKTRVFRYAPKVIELTASKEYDDPVRQIALRAVFTHQATSKSYTIWGFPLSKKRWQIRFVPTRTGKWKYKISTVVQTLPGTQIKTQKDKRLQDRGLFKVLPSARAGRLVVSGGNAVRFAWKKVKEAAKNKVKAKKKAGKKVKKKKSPIPEDETVMLWQGLNIPNLFSTKLTEKRFLAHQKMLELVTPSAIYVDMPLEELFQWEDGKPVKVLSKRMEALSKRLDTMRKNPNYKWALVYNLRTDDDLKPAQLQHAIQYLCGRFGHVDVLWSLHQWEGKTRDKVVGFLRSYDAYQQPIALPYDETLAKRIDKLPKDLLKRLQAPPKPKLAKKPKAGKDGKKGKKKAKPPTLFKPNPKYKHFVWHTTHNIATGKALQKFLLRPWIGDIPLPVELEPKQLRKQWWKLYIAGISTTIVLDRALNDDEIQSISKWQRKAYEAEKLPLHPDDEEAKKAKAAKAAKAKTKQAKAPKARPAARKATAKSKAVAKAPAGKKPTGKKPVGKKPKARKALAKVTPKGERISRPYIHYLRVRHYWAKFLGKIRFSGFIRPSMIRTVMPDLTALKKWRAAQQKKQFTLPGVRLAPPGSNGQKGKIRKQLKPPTKRLARDRFGKKKINLKNNPSLKRPSVEWKQVLLRGFLASNGPTVLFVPPSTKFKKPPRINWRKSRWDLEFRWYNAANGTFLKKKVFRQVTSLALTAPKKEAHIAKVSVQDHKMNNPYTVMLPPKLLKKATSQPKKPSSRPAKKKNTWVLDDWKLWVQSPKPRGPGGRPNPKAPRIATQVVSFVRTSQGFVARFLPNRMGVWTFHITYKGKKLKGFWGNAGKIQVLPSGLPAPVQRAQKSTRMMAGGRPYFFFAQSVPNLLSNTWTQEQFQNTIKALPRKHPGTTVLVTTLPKLSWTSVVATKATTRPQSKESWNPKLAEQLDQLEQRIKAAHEAGYHIALVLSKQQWGQIFQTGTHRLEYLLDRFANAYPLMWLVDKSKEKTTRSFLPMLIRAWYLRNYPTIQKALVKSKGKAKPKEQPAVPPPMMGVHIGRPRSEKQLKAAVKTYDWLWLNTKSLEKEIKDFKLLQLKRPIVFTWRPLQQAQSPFVALGKNKKPTLNKKNLKRWAGFLWRSQMIGFGHAGRPVQDPLPAPKKVKKGQTAPKPKVAAVQKVPMVLRAFFQTFNWAQLRPPSRAISFRSYEAFSAETPARAAKQKNGKVKLQMGRDGHHIVAWINPTIRQYLQIKRAPQFPLKKHRYLWINPLSGDQPVTPQLLPPKPGKGQRDQLQVPFRPAVLYVFRRPPQKGRRNQRRRRRQRKQNRNASKRQQVRNQVRNLQENRNPRKRQRRRRSLTGKRG